MIWLIVIMTVKEEPFWYWEIKEWTREDESKTSV